MSDPRLADMISRMAHELRSPLTSVKGFSSMLLKRWDKFTDEQKYHFVETIHYDAERMGRIVSEVLDLARIESGRLELHRAVHELLPIANGAAARMAIMPGSDRIAVEVAGDLTVDADAERLESVLANLLENATKFSDEGPIRLVAESNGNGVVITVSDEGVGIETERREEIFQGPQSSPSAATPSGGGLGLYLARGIMKAHGGTIAVESEPGQGATFTVHVPVRDAQ